MDNINMKLINKIKPEVLEALKESKIKYRASYTMMITDLERNKCIEIIEIPTLSY